MAKQVTTKEVQQVTTKNPEKMEVGKRLAEYNRKKKEELKVQSEAHKSEEQKSEVNQSFKKMAEMSIDNLMPEEVSIDNLMH